MKWIQNRLSYINHKSNISYHTTFTMKQASPSLFKVFTVSQDAAPLLRQTRKNINYLEIATYGSPPPNDLTAPWGPRPPHCSRLHDHTSRHTTLGRTPLDKGPARRRDRYLTSHNTHKSPTAPPSVGFEPTIPVSERPQTYALDCAATWIGTY
jgi:hypothetical protein